MAHTLRINGVERKLDADDDTPLLWALRDGLHLTGTKFGCGVASCGACTVLVEGVPTRACQLPISDAAGKEILTIEGLSGPVAEAVKGAWRDLDVVQCGYCQSGQIVSAVGLLTATPKPDDAQILAAMDGNLCRCGAYGRIKAAVRAASDKLGG